MGKIGKYKILQELTPHGRRDTNVYKVSLQSHNYVIKTFPKKKSKYAKKEFDILIKLKNINGIVNVLDIFEWNDRICLLEDYVDGINLANYIKTYGGVSEPGKIINRLANIFSEMHEYGIVHRDIKPANIIIMTNNNLPIVIDFDNALRIEDYDGQRTDVTGTPYHMAPELGAYYNKGWMLRDYDWIKA
ncbi:unnamed protein product, partial [marine sediment metagenome]